MSKPYTNSRLSVLLGQFLLTNVADRIGVNPSWMRVQCDLGSPANRRAQHELRADS
jgi:hypothetical protein